MPSLHVAIDARQAQQGAQQFQQAAGKVTQSAQKAAQQVEVLARRKGLLQRAGESLNTVLGKLGVTLGTAIVVRATLQAVNTFQTLENRLRLVEDTMGDVVERFQDLQQISTATRSSLEANVQLYSRLAQNTKALGLDTADLLEITENLNKAVIISGASAQEASAGLIQLSQGLASGTLRGDELRSVLEQLPKVADVIADSLGVTRGELRKLGEEGQITAEQVTTAFLNVGDSIDREFSQTVPTMAQQLGLLRNAFIEFGGAIEDIVAPPVVSFLQFVTFRLNEIVRAIQEIQALDNRVRGSGPTTGRELQQAFLERGLTAEGGVASQLGLPQRIARSIAQAEFGALSAANSSLATLPTQGGAGQASRAERQRLGLKEAREDIGRINDKLRETKQVLDLLSQARGIPVDVLSQAASIVEGDVVIDEQKLAQVMREQAKAADEMAEAIDRSNESLEKTNSLTTGAVLAFERLQDEVSATNVGFDVTFSTVRALTGEFSNFVSGIKTAGDAFRDFGRRVIRVLADIAAQLVVVNILRGLGNTLSQINFSGIFSAGGPEGGVVGPPIPGTPEANALNSRLQAERNAGVAPPGAVFGPPLPEAQTGGVLSGPRSGFLALLHGTEEVRPVSRVSKQPLNAPLGTGGGQIVNNFFTITAIDTKSFDDRLKEGVARQSRFIGEAVDVERSRNLAAS